MKIYVMQSPYRRGAEDGWKFGLYLTALFFSSIFSSALPLLGLLSLVLAIGVPVVITWFLRQYNKACHRTATFAMLWMQGVMIFFCGMLIAGALLVIYMRWINPGFILSQWQAAVAYASANPSESMQQIAQMAQQMIDSGILPSAMSIVVEFTMLAVASGSILSLIIGAIIAASNRRPPKFTQV